MSKEKKITVFIMNNFISFLISCLFVLCVLSIELP